MTLQRFTPCREYLASFMAVSIRCTPGQCGSISRLTKLECVSVWYSEPRYSAWQSAGGCPVLSLTSQVRTRPHLSMRLFGISSISSSCYGCYRVADELACSLRRPPFAPLVDAFSYH